MYIPGVSIGETDEYYPFVQDSWSHAQAGSPEIDITCVRCSRVIHNLFNSSQNAKRFHLQEKLIHSILCTLRKSSIFYSGCTYKVPTIWPIRRHGQSDTLRYKQKPNSDKRVSSYREICFSATTKKIFPSFFSISITCCQLYVNGSLIFRNTRVIYATDCQFRQRRFVRLINRFCPPDKPLWRVSIRPQYHARVRVLGNSIYALIVLRFLVSYRCFEIHNRV